MRITGAKRRLFIGNRREEAMPQITATQEQEDAAVFAAGPTSPDDDETYGPEPDDPRAAGSYHDPYDVPDYDPAHEQQGCACQGAH
jgi:hypothetical protein